MPRNTKRKSKAQVEEPVKMTQEEKKEQDLLEECVLHQSQSEAYLATIRDTWDEKEAMLLGKLEDAISKKTKNKVFDHRLSTIIFERAARVMAQNPKGKAYAVSSDDIGKNALMNLLLPYGIKRDKLQFSHLLKQRLMDLYSMVYGSMFELVFWFVNPKNGYVGPQTYIIPIRDAFPQPGVRNVNDMDWFIVRNSMTTQSLKALVDSKNPYWKTANIARLLNDLKQKKFEGDKATSKENQRSYVERTLFPSEAADKAFPKVECFTEYRFGMWITWASQHTDETTQRNYLLRVVDPGMPYTDMLPVVAKHCFPLLDAPIGLGEFERGKTLQYALNSLINLYLDGVKYSIFPPLAINPDNVVPSSIKWGAGERWFMNSPNQDVQPVNLSPKGIQTFNETYSFMLSALYNQAGTSEVNQTQKTESGLGKTPQAVRLQAVRESARDEWDRFMMEDTLYEVYLRFVLLYAYKQETKVTMRLFKREIEELEKTAPDVMELVKQYKSKERGTLEFDKTNLADDGNPVEWDMELEIGSTTKPNIESDQENLTAILKAVLENPDINKSLAAQGKQVDIGELFKMWITAGGRKDVDKIIIPIKAVDQGTNPGAPVETNANAGAGGPSAEEIAAAAGGGEGSAAPAENTAAPANPNGPGSQIQDPDIKNLISTVLGGRNGIPQGAA